MTRIAPLALLLLPGCFLFGDREADMPYCEEIVTVLGMDEVSALGFSGADLVALAEGTHVETLRWSEDGATTELTLEVAITATEVRYVDAEPVYPEEGDVPAIGIECPDSLEVDATLGFTTADGAFAESFATEIASYEGEQAFTWITVDPEELEGTWTYTLMDPSEYDELSLFVDMAFDADGSTGVVYAQASGAEECDDDECTAWATQDEVATWPAEAAE